MCSILLQCHPKLLRLRGRLTGVQFNECGKFHRRKRFWLGPITNVSSSPHFFICCQNNYFSYQLRYDELATLNGLTTPDVFGLNNYTAANVRPRFPLYLFFPSNYKIQPNSYSDPQGVTDAKNTLTNLIQTNTTVYNEIDTVCTLTIFLYLEFELSFIQAKSQLGAAQGASDQLRTEVAQFEVKYDNIEVKVHQLSTTNISNCIASIDVCKEEGKCQISDFFFSESPN